MKKIILILISIPFFSFGQNDEQYEQFVLSSCLPSEYRAKLSNSNFFDRYILNKNLNPFYLRGDFNGDKIMDYAISIIDKETNKYGIVIMFEPNNYHLIGVGTPLSNRNIDDFNWMDAWQVYDDKDVGLGVGESEKITLNTEAILAIKTESASGIIYWNGKEFLWYQQGD